MRLILCAALASCVAALPAAAGAELLLEDGQLIEGRAVQRKDALYLLELDTGGVLPVPVELVRQVRLTGDDDPVPGGLQPAEPQTLAGRPGGPALPSPHEQVEVLGDGSRFQRNVIDPHWQPTSDWRMDPELNNFNPARWYKAPIDSTWHPRSAYRASTDVTQFNPARWYASPIDPTWWPTDGFRAMRESSRNARK